MAATELITNIIGNISDYEVHIPTGRGNTYPDTSAWLTQKISSGINCINNVTLKVLVANNNGLGWAAFDEPVQNGTIRTIFEIS